MNSKAIERTLSIERQNYSNYIIFAHAFFCPSSVMNTLFNNIKLSNKDPKNLTESLFYMQKLPLS